MRQLRLSMHEASLIEHISVKIARDLCTPFHLVLKSKDFSSDSSEDDDMEIDYGKDSSSSSQLTRFVVMNFFSNE